jgi:hypothetical protein
VGVRVPFAGEVAIAPSPKGIHSRCHSGDARQILEVEGHARHGDKQRAEEQKKACKQPDMELGRICGHKNRPTQINRDAVRNHQSDQSRPSGQRPQKEKKDEKAVIHRDT